MWLGIKLEWWGFIFGAAAVVLAIPMGIVANFLTPAFFNWLAERSASSLKKRVALLEGQLAQLERDCPLVSATEEQILNGLVCTSTLSTFTIQLFGVLGMTYLFEEILHTIGNIAVERGVILGGISLLCFFLPWTWRKSVIDPMDKYRVDHSPLARKQLHESIESLRESLAQRS